MLHVKSLQTNIRSIGFQQERTGHGEEGGEHGGGEEGGEHGGGEERREHR